MRSKERYQERESPLENTFVPIRDQIPIVIKSIQLVYTREKVRQPKHCICGNNFL